MSKQQYLGGTSLVVDKIVQLRGKSEKVTEDLSLALQKVNVQQIVGEIEDIISDSKIYKNERQSLRRDYLSAVGDMSSFASQADALGILDQTAYISYKVAQTVLLSALRQILDSPEDPVDILDMNPSLARLYEDYYNRSNVLAQQILDLQQGVLNGIDVTAKLKMTVQSMSGASLQQGYPTALIPHVFLADSDITDSTVDQDFTWSRLENYWGREGTSVKNLSLGEEDLENGVGTFQCTFRQQQPSGKFLYAVGIYTLRLYIAPHFVQITSSYGDKFRFDSNDKGLSTVLSAHVYQEDHDVTSTLVDSNFRWRRKSASDDPLDDERWNTLSKTIGKSIAITNEDCFGRTVFSCEVDI